jgi:DNA-binding response OmpR family regulator
MKKLLIVDDDPHIRRLLRIYLRDSGFLIAEAATGEEASTRMSGEHFDVILLDLILPYQGGFVLCQRAKDLREPPWVVIMTGEDSPESRATATECGADAFLAKPFTREDVDTVLPKARG